MSRPFFDRVSDYVNDPYYPTNPVLAVFFVLRDILKGDV